VTQLDYAMGWLVLMRPDLIRYFNFEDRHGWISPYVIYLSDLWNERLEREVYENRKG